MASAQHTTQTQKGMYIVHNLYVEAMTFKTSSYELTLHSRLHLNNQLWISFSPDLPKRQLWHFIMSAYVDITVLYGTMLCGISTPKSQSEISTRTNVYLSVM